MLNREFVITRESYHGHTLVVRTSRVVKKEPEKCEILLLEGSQPVE